MSTNDTDSNDPINPAMSDALQRAAEQNNAKSIKAGKEGMTTSKKSAPRKKRKTHLERANDAIKALMACNTYKEAYDIVTKEGKYIESKRPEAMETVNNLLAGLRGGEASDIIPDDSVKNDKSNKASNKPMKEQANTESTETTTDTTTDNTTENIDNVSNEDTTTETVDDVVVDDITDETVVNAEEAFKKAENGENIEDAVIEDVVDETKAETKQQVNVTSIDLPIETFLFPSMKLDTKSDEKSDKKSKKKEAKKPKEATKPSIVDFVKSETTFVNNNSRKDTFSYIALALINKCSLTVSSHLTAIVHRFV